MPFDSNGNFSLVPGTIVSDGMTIQPSQHNPPFQDVANGFSQVVLRDGRAPMTGPLNMNGYKVTGIAEGTADTDAATVGQSAFRIGDFKDSARSLDFSWLRRDGAAYNVASYPELSALFPPQTDAVIWTEISDGLPSENLLSVASSSARDIAISFVNGSECHVFIRDGGEWEEAHTLENFFPTSANYLNGNFIIAGSRFNTGIGVIVVSADNGETFGTAISVSGDVSTITDLAYDGTVYVAVGNGGRVWSSSDLLTWTENTSPVAENLLSVTHDGSIFIAVGNIGKIITSVNGSTWTERTSGVSVPLYGVTSGAGQIVAVGANGTIVTSANGTTWTVRASSVTADLYGVAVSNAGFLAVGDAGAAAASNDGVAWSARNSGSASILRAVSIANDNTGVFTVVGSAGYAAAAEKTLPTQFRVPDDDPEFGWIKAL